MTIIKLYFFFQKIH